MAVFRRQFLALAVALPTHALLARSAAAASPAAAPTPVVTDDTWTDATLQRQIPVRVRWPSGAAPAGGWPVVLFSHGLGGSVDAGTVWGEAWAAAGLVVVHLQHPGSDTLAVREALRGGDGGGLRATMAPQQLLARLGDVRFVLEEIVHRHATGAQGWRDARPTQVGMSGHSFGAHTTLGMAGQAYPGMAALSEPRLTAFAVFSPSPPQDGDLIRAFATITRPTLCLTGTLDADVVGNGATPERRAAVFAALPAGAKAQLVLKDADHMTFGGQQLTPHEPAWRALRRAPAARDLQAQHQKVVTTLTTDWWRAHLLDDAQALARLAQPRGLATGDTWQRG